MTVKEVIRFISDELHKTTVGQEDFDKLVYLEDFVSTFDGDANDLDRLSVELQQLYTSESISTPNSSLSSNTEDLSARHLIIIKCLRKLLTLLGQERFVGDWWEPILKPLLCSQNRYRPLVNECNALILDAMSLENSDSTSPKPDFRKKIFEIYINQASPILIDLSWLENVEKILLSYGSSHTKEFFNALNEYFLIQSSRIQVLTLLVNFLRRQDIHIHYISQSPLLDSIMQSLLVDSSVTTITLGLTVTSMLLPHIVPILPKLLPKLLAIIARALCWDREKNSSIPKEATLFPNWEVDESSTDEDLIAPNANMTFTFIYGLFPCNLLKYITSPPAYAQFYQELNLGPPWMEEEVDTLRTKAQ
ncbi:hypothetical protein K7432_013029, partial [Basidiobolus ranarum]